MSPCCHWKRTQFPKSNTFCDVTFVHPTLSRKELEDGLVGIYKAIYSKEVQEAKVEHFSEIYRNLRKNGEI